MRKPFLCTVSQILIAVASLSVPAYARNRAIVFGGNCEGDPRKSTAEFNAFRSKMIDAADGLRRNGWEVVPLYDGRNGRCSTPEGAISCRISLWANCCSAGINPAKWSVEPMAQAAGVRDAKNVGFASKKELLRSLDEAVKTLHSGDQLLLSIDTHGGRTEKGEHLICMSEGVMGIDDPEFLSRLDKLKKSGVRLGFLDGGCYGGGSVPVLAKYGCVLSSQTATSEANSLLDFDLTADEIMSAVKEGDVSDEAARGPKRMTGKVFGGVTVELGRLLHLPPERLRKLSLSGSRISLDEVFLSTLVYAGLKAAEGDHPQSSDANMFAETTDLLAHVKQTNARDVLEQVKKFDEGGAADCTETPDAFRAIRDIKRWVQAGCGGTDFSREEALLKGYLAAIEPRSQYEAGFLFRNQKTTALPRQDLERQIEQDARKIDAFARKFNEGAKREQEVLEQLEKLPIQYEVRLSQKKLGLTQLQLMTLVSTEPWRIGLDVCLGSNIEGDSLRLKRKGSCNPSTTDWGALTKLASNSIFSNDQKKAERLIEQIKEAELEAWQKVPEDLRRHVLELRQENQQMVENVLGKEHYSASFTNPLNELHGLIATARFYDYVNHCRDGKRKPDVETAPGQADVAPRSACADFTLMEIK